MAINFYKGESMSIVFSAYDNSTPPQLLDISDYTPTVQVFTPYSSAISPTVTVLSNSSFSVTVTASDTQALKVGNFNIVVKLTKGSEVRIGKAIPCKLVDAYTADATSSAIIDSGTTPINVVLDSSVVNLDMFFGTASIIVDGAVLDTDVALGGASSSNAKVASQLATKTYTDGQISTEATSRSSADNALDEKIKNINTGHDHDGADSKKIDHANLENKGTNTHAQIDGHIASTVNPHSVTKAQVGLDKVENLTPAEMPVSTDQQSALDLKVDKVTGKGLSTNDYDNTEKAAVANSVRKTGDETIVGVKTFSSFPVTPYSAPATDYQTANKKFVVDADALKIDKTAIVNNLAETADGKVLDARQGKAIKDNLVQIESNLNKLDAKVNAMHGQIFYGVERTRGAADPAFTAIGNTDQHVSLPLHRMIRACKAGEDRKIRNYLNQTNWNYNADGTASVLDGSDGLDVMLHYPHVWAVLDGGGSDGTKERWIISDGPFTYDGDVAIEIKSYLDSPDFCTLQSGVNKLRSVRNETASFAGSGSLATTGGLGYPRTVISRYNNEIYAGNKGAEWKAWYYRDHLVLAAFMYIEYKTKNLKSVFGNMGHNWSSSNWTAYNNIYPVRKIFETHLALSGTPAIVSKGHLTGTFTKHFEFLNAEIPVVYDTPFGVYRGKVLWGDIWKWFCGIEHEVQSDAAGGVSNIWIQFNPALIDANRSDSSFLFKDTYTFVGTAPRVSGWSKSTHPKSKQAREMGGGETTYDCMYFYTSPPASGTARRGVLEGASLLDGSSCAFGHSSTYGAPTSASSHFGVGCRADVDE